VVRQITSNPRALMIVSALLIGFAVIPGLPKLPFIVMGAASGIAAYFIQQTEQPGAEAKDGAEEQKQTTPSLAEPEAVTELLQMDNLEVEIGYGLIPLIEANSNTGLLNRITMIRRQIALEAGFILPKIRIRDNLQLPPNVYSIKLRGEEIAQGNLMPGHYLAMASGPVAEELAGISTTEPAFGLPAVWIEAAHKERSETLGYTVVDPASVVATHLTEVIKKHAPEILTRQDTRDLLDNLKKDYPALVEGLVPNLMSLSEVHEVLKNLLRERVSIRDLVTILETISNLAANIKDPDLLSEAARQSLARSISNQHRAHDGAIHVITLSPRVEQILQEGMSNQGIRLALDPYLAQQLLEVTAQSMEEIAAQGYVPIVLCSAAVRLAFKRLTERALPNLVILSYSEIAPGVDVQAKGMLELPEANGQ
jgi:flagellar biosynthesis protein FlhA